MAYRVLRGLPPNEKQIQMVYMDWAMYHPDLKDIIHHIPNGERRPSKTVTTEKGKTYIFSLEGVELKKMGVRKGVFDIFVPLARGKYHGFYLELKRHDGKPTKEQLIWQELMFARGYFAEFAYSFEEAKNITESYLALGIISSPIKEEGNHG